MIFVLSIIGLLLLVAGIACVWQGNWRVMWGAQAYMALFVAGCLTVDYWYHLAGISRGDGFALIGIIMFGVMAAGVSLAALVVAGIIHSIRGNRGAVVQIEGKSGVE